MQLFLTAFQSVPDPRAANVRHNLAELLIIAFLAVLCGATCCVGMQAFGEARIDFLKRFLTLRYGIPSHDTFSTVLRMLDPKALDVAFGGLSKRLVAALGDAGVIAIDGKTLKGAYDKGRASEAEMMVSAYATGLRLTPSAPVQHRQTVHPNCRHQAMRDQRHFCRRRPRPEEEVERRAIRYRSSERIRSPHSTSMPR